MDIESESSVVDEVTIQRYCTPEAFEEEKKQEKRENSLRPTKFDDYPGQGSVKENLKVYVKAAAIREQPLDHVLLHGPPGLGKTTLAKIVAHELGVPFYQISGPSIDKPGDLAGILAGLDPRSVLFVDEIHRLPIKVEEVLYSAMEDFFVDVLVGQGPTARTVELAINPFTLIGATTRAALLSSPLISRFGIQERLEFYDCKSLMTILKRSASIWGIELDDEGAKELALRSRGTPRIANRLLRRARDFADFKDIQNLSIDVVRYTLDRLDIDSSGLDRMDRKILRTILDHYNGGPVGLDTLAATCGEEKSTIEDVYEPYLLHQGFLVRGPRGRAVSEKGKSILRGNGIL